MFRTTSFDIWVRVIESYVDEINRLFLGVINGEISKNIFTRESFDGDEAFVFLTVTIPVVLPEVKEDADKLGEMMKNARNQWLGVVTKSQKEAVLDLVTKLYTNILSFIREAMDFIRFRVMHVTSKSHVKYSPKMYEFDHTWYYSNEFASYARTATNLEIRKLDGYVEFTKTIEKILNEFARSPVHDIIIKLPVPMWSSVGGSICTQCKAPATLQCSRCKTAHYCSTDCQATDWHTGQHKLVCVNIAATK